MHVRTLARGHERRRCRGTLSTTLLIFILALGCLAVSTLTTLFQLNLRHEDDATDGARRMAESAVRLMIARLLADPALNAATCPKLEVTLASYPGAQGVVALDPVEASNVGIPVSVNNLAGSGSLPGWGDTVVPAETANIVGVGRYRNRERRVEAILHRPKFPYVLSSSLPIAASDLHVFAVKDPSAILAGFGSVPREMKVPGHVVTNATDGVGPSLQLSGATTLIEGDAQSRGTLQLAPGAVVTGALRPLADLAPLPRLDVRSLDTASRPGVNVLTSDSLGATTLSGFNRRTGALAVDGGLSLDGGVLYVDGAVSIRGGLSGTGAVIANGPVRIEGGGALTGLTGTAVVSSDDIRMEGTAQQRAEFRGLLYAEGNLACRHVNVAGSVVVNSQRADGRVELESAAMAENPDLGVVTVQVVTTVPGPPGDLTPFPATLHANLVSLGDPYGFGVGPAMQRVRGTSDTVPTLFTANMNGPRPDYATPPAGYPVTHRPTQAEPWYEIGVPDPMPADPVTLGSIRVNNPDPNGEVETVGKDGDGFQSAFRGDFTDRQSARAALIAVAEAWGSRDAAAATDRFLDASARYMVDTVPEIVRVWNLNSRAVAQGQGSGGSGTGTRTVTNWKLDVNEFFNVSDRIRLLSWRVL